MSTITVDQALAHLPEGTRVTAFGPGALFDTVLIQLPGKDQFLLNAGTCTTDVGVNLNDPVAQASCSLC